jgi:tRNA A37 threonylcarbamoyladenosine dehydratase
MGNTSASLHNPFLRTALLLGAEAAEALKKSRVAIFGIGGVGSYAAEALARCGIGHFSLIDHDIVDITNINRQIHALHSTLGQYKTDVMRRRILDINPDAQVTAHPIFFTGEASARSDANGDMPLSKPMSPLNWDYDYVIDAVDTVTAKLQIILSAQSRGIPIVSSMGAGNKLDPSRFKAADIYETHTCPLAKIMRQLCRTHKIERLRVVFSTETPIRPPTRMHGRAVRGANDQPQAHGRAVGGANDQPQEKKPPLGSIAFVPSAAGLLLAAEAVNYLIKTAHP